MHSIDVRRFVASSASEECEAFHVRFPPKLSSYHHRRDEKLFFLYAIRSAKSSDSHPISSRVVRGDDLYSDIFIVRQECN